MTIESECIRDVFNVQVYFNYINRKNVIDLSPRPFA